MLRNVSFVCRTEKFFKDLSDDVNVNFENHYARREYDDIEDPSKKDICVKDYTFTVFVYLY